MKSMTEKNITRILLLAAIIFSFSRIPDGLQAEPPTVTFETTAFDEPAIAEVRIFAGNFAPRGWAFCHGQILSINQNQALFSLIGTTYGGDGRTTFGLPDLRGRSVVGAGAGAGLANVQLGQKLGSSSATVNINPTVAAGGSEGQAAPPRPPSRPNATDKKLMTAARPDSPPNRPSTTITQPPSPQTIDLHQPSLGLNYIIALQGIYPSRN